MRRMVQQDPSRLPQLLQEMGQSNPSLLQMISRNQEEFMHILNEPVEQTGQESGPTGGEGGPQHIQVTQQEKEAIERLKQLGFSEAECIQAYFACEKNENLAANYLLSNQGNNEDS